MRKFNIFSISVLLISTMLFSSCKDEALQQEQQKPMRATGKPNEEIRSYIVPLEKALEELASTLKFLDEVNDFKTDFSSRPQAKDIIFLTKDNPVFTRLNNDFINDTVLYVVEFENENGFAILSADYRYMPIVIAVIEYGNFSDFCKLGEVYENEMNKGIKEFDDFWVGIIGGQSGGFGMTLIEKWIDFTTLITVDGKRLCVECIIDPLDSVVHVETVLKDFVSPMLTTLWHQSSPFNDDCPKKCNPPKNAPAGCVAVAVGQIVAYHEYPKTIDGYSYDYTGMKRVNSKIGSV